jgi:SAM-dependent methyltransferase
MKADVYKKVHCRLCGGKQLERVIELVPTPPGNHFVPERDRGKVQKAYPLDVEFCHHCHHLQLGHVVHPEILYQKNYSYVSGTSPVFVKHLRDYARHVIGAFGLPPRGLVLDIGSNDGTALSFFKEAGYQVLGIDPAIEIVEGANRRGIETLCEFFGLDVARKYSAQYGKAMLINSHNACAHIDDLRGVIEGVEHWLADDGLFVVEVGYLLDIVQNAWFDTIYHEHVDFHSVAPLVGFFRRCGLEVISGQRVSPQGGSIRLVAQKVGGPRKADRTVQELIEVERVAGLDRVETFQAFARKINQIGADLSKLVQELKQQGASIAGFGAPTKATTLLSHFRLGQALDFLVDENPLKQNLYSPGHHIPVVSAEELYRRKPDYLLILAWNFAGNIMERHRAFRDHGGRFILPMPTPKICD